MVRTGTDTGSSTERKSTRGVPCGCVGALTALSCSTALPSQRISLTEERVLISKADDPLRVFDFINLDEVVECELKADEEPVQQMAGRPDSPDSALGGIEKDPENLELIIRTTEDGVISKL